MGGRPATRRRLELDDLERVISDDTSLVCFTQASNLVGSAHDVAAITRLVHERGARVCVDGVAYAPHRPIDVHGWDVDYYVCSVYKIYGPHLACLYGKRELLAGLSGINHFFIEDAPYKLQPGHAPYELVHALSAVVDYLESLDFAAVAAHERALTARLLEFLDGKKNVRVLGERTASATRVPTISFTVDGTASPEIVRADRRRAHRHQARRLPLAPPRRPPRPRARAAVSCACRWCTTTPSRKSIGCAPRSRLA